MSTPSNTPLATAVLLDPATAEPDESIAARLRTGDVAALDALFRRHAKALLRLATSLTGSPSDGEDVVQDVFVGLELALRRYEEQGAFAAWLRGVTVRTALAHRRRATRRQEDSLDLANTRRTIPSSAENRLAIQDAVRRLPVDMRDVFILKVVEGYSHNEIATLLGIRAGTSEVRLFRAIRLLRATLLESP